MRLYTMSCLALAVSAAAVLVLAPASADAATITYHRFEPGSPLADSGPKNLALTNLGSDNANDFVAPPGRSQPVVIPQTLTPNGQAAVFTSSEQDAFSTADNAAFAVGSFTIEAFIRPSTFDNRRIIASQWSFNGPQRSWYLSLEGGNRLQLTVSEDDTGGSAQSTPFATLPMIATKDYYVAASIETDGADAAITLYSQNLTDGGPLNSASVTLAGVGSINDSSADFVVGAEASNGGSNFFDGLIDEVRLSSGVLAEEDLLIAVVPEPATATLTLVGLGLMAARRRR